MRSLFINLRKSTARRPTASALACALLASVLVAAAPASPAFAASEAKCEAPAGYICYTPAFNPPGETLHISVNAHCPWQTAQWHVFDTVTQVTVANGATWWGESYRTVDGLSGSYQGYVYSPGNCGARITLS